MHEGERARLLFQLLSYAAASPPPARGRVGMGGHAALSELAFQRGQPEKHGPTPSLALPRKGAEGGRERASPRAAQNRPARSSPPRPSGEGDGVALRRHVSWTKEHDPCPTL